MPSLNGHFYAVLSGATSYDDAIQRAAASSYQGLTGYLATIDSVAEYALLRWSVKIDRAWVSGTDAAQEGTWRFNTGPSSGTTASLLWAAFEPNGWNVENCAVHIEIGVVDTSCNNQGISSFVVEYDCPAPKIVFQGACIRMCLYLLSSHKSCIQSCFFFLFHRAYL